MIYFIAFASLAALHDSWLSWRRIKDYGVGVELNPLTSYLCRIGGPLNGVIAGVLLPHFLFTYFSWVYEWEAFYIFYTGWYAHLFLIQRASLALERTKEKSKHPK